MNYKEKKYIVEKEYFERCDENLLVEADSFIKVHQFDINNNQARRQASNLAFLIIESLCKSITDYNRNIVCEIQKMPILPSTIIYIKDSGTIINKIKFILIRDSNAHKLLQKLERIIISNENKF